MIHNAEYEKAWKDDEESAPLAAAVDKARMAMAEKDDEDDEYVQAHRALDEEAEGGGESGEADVPADAPAADADAEEVAKKGAAA